MTITKNQLEAVGFFAFKNVMRLGSRQKQYFEQRKRQQQCQPQTERCETYADEMDISRQQQKEHRSLDILSILNLSENARERKSDCLSDVYDVSITYLTHNTAGRKNPDVNASTREYNITNDSPVILPDRAVLANLVGINEQSIPSGFHMETSSLKNHRISPSAPDSHNNALNGVDCKRDQRTSATEQEMSVLDLLGDDGLNGNVVENPGHEAHVAFSIEGLGKVGAETPVHSPQQSSRTFSYGISSPLKAAGRQKSSRKFNSQIDDLEFEVDAMLDGLNDPLSNIEFSPNIVDSINSPENNSFTVRDSWQQDNYSSKRYSAFGHGNEDKWTGRPTFSHHRFFDEREHEKSRKTWQSQIHDSSADHLLYRNSENDMSDFSFEGLHQPMRAGDRISSKFDLLDSTFSYARHPTAEYDHDYYMSNWDRLSKHVTVDRAPTVENILDFKPETSPPDRFCFMTEDAIDNSSLQSEESCSSSAVRYQATGNFLSNSSRQGRRRQCNVLAGSGDKHAFKKAFANVNKDDIQQENMASGSAKRINMINNLRSKPSYPSSFQRSFGAEDISFFEGAHTTIDMNPGSDSFNQNLGTKNNSFHSDFLDEDPFCKFPTPKLHGGSNPSCDRFNCDSAECSPPELFIPKIPLHASSMNMEPDIHVDCELRRRPQDSSSIAGSQGETPSPDLSAQESFSKDVEYKPKFEPSNCGPSELEEEFCIRNGDLVCKDKKAKDASHTKDNDHKDRKESLPDLEETSRSVDITDKIGSPAYDEDDRADKTPHSYKNMKEEVEDFGCEGRFGYKQKSGYAKASTPVKMACEHLREASSNGEGRKE
ncbi:hypothetical protein G4B88_008775 [Cannabis sativa]|uniref:Uncharacterized protein n=1 Tax=Cannabis sativa TaxID=3483 RepID=A0A7J6GCH0_CANSA|nr:hypothetical protein G4B88_008775 [Cannabis sativa]